MADSRTILLLDSAGAPLTTATPVFADYRDKSTGTSRTAPANPVHLGAGLYAFTPSASDETVGTVALVDGGATAFPRYTTVAIHLGDNTNQFCAWHLEDGAGVLWTGAAGSIGAYRDVAGNARTPPSVVTLSGAYLFSLTPSAADVTAETSIRIDAPAGASTPYLFTDTSPVISSSGPIPVITPSTGLRPEQLAVNALIDYLRMYLPIKVTELNGLRAATLQTPGVGTGSAVGWSITGTKQIKVTSVSRDDAGTLVTLPTGSAVTAAQIATAINTAAPSGLTASADTTGRVVLTSNTAPASSNSFVGVLPDTTGGNALLGWEAGGESSLTAPLRAPTFRGIMDGRPTNAPDAGVGFWVIVGDRSARPWPSPGADLRRNETDVAITLEIYKPESNLAPIRSREGISAAVRAVREVIQSTTGRQLNRASAGDIVRVDITGVNLRGVSFSFTDTNSPNVLFDAAQLSLSVRVYQQTD